MNQDRDCASWLYAEAGLCRGWGEPVPNPSRVVLLGPPGVGKGTQASMLCAKLKACQLSTGEVFRVARTAPEASLTPLMREAVKIMASGGLVPDELVVSMIRERVHCLSCKHGFMLDGFPRTVAQAAELDALLENLGLALDVVVSYELPVEDVLRRLSGRRTCAECHATYHLDARPPKIKDVCDLCGGALYQREDDRPESIQVRLAAYEASTAPLKAYYDEQGLLCLVSAEGTPVDVLARTEAQLEDFFGTVTR